jgi:hypothetical protein
MAKKAKVDNKELLWDVLGKALVAHTQGEIDRLKVGSNPESLLVSLDGTDFEVRLIQKKAELEYEQEDIRATYNTDGTKTVHEKPKQEKKAKEE